MILDRCGILMNYDGINEKIKALKSTGKVYSNYFGGFDFSSCEVFTTEKTVLIVKHEYKVDRLYYYTLEISDFLECVFACLSCGEYCLNMATKTPEQFQKEFNDAGFKLIARMKRLSVSDISFALSEQAGVSCYYDKSIGRFADNADVDTIYDLLWNVFDTCIGHLPDKAEIEQAVARNEFMIYYGENNKLSLLQTDIKPKSFYINQVINRNEKHIIHAMLLNRIEQYCANGGKYAYSWVEENNIASMKFHEKYNFKHDGLWDIVYKVRI